MEKVNDIKLNHKVNLNEIKSRDVDSRKTPLQLPVYTTTTSSRMENPFEKLNTDLTEIKMMLRLLMEQRPVPIEKSDLIDIDEATDVLKLSKSTIYKMTAASKIPYIKRVGSTRLMFSRSNLDTWMRESERLSTDLVDHHLHMKLRVRKSQQN